MTNSELVNKFLDHRGYSKIKGESLLPIMPYIVMDVVYNMYNKTIRPIPAKHKLKKLKTTWEEAYNRFDRVFLAAFTEDEQDEIIDRMDDLEAYIANAKTIAEIQTMNCFSFLSLEQQKVLACANVCNLLTHYAGEIWKAVYKNYDLSRDTWMRKGVQYYEIKGKIYKERPNKSKELSDIERASEKLMDEYYAFIGGPKDVSFQNCPQMRESCLALVKTIYKWLEEN